MRYPASEKLEIIRLVERSSLSVRRTLAQLGSILQLVRPVHYRRTRSLGRPEATAQESVEQGAG